MIIFLHLRRCLRDQVLLLGALGDSNSWRGSNKYSGQLTVSIYLTLCFFAFFGHLVIFSVIWFFHLFGPLDLVYGTSLSYMPNLFSFIINLLKVEICGEDNWSQNIVLVKEGDGDWKFEPILRRCWVYLLMIVLYLQVMWRQAVCQNKNWNKILL